MNGTMLRKLTPAERLEYKKQYRKWYHQTHRAEQNERCRDYYRKHGMSIKARKRAARLAGFQITEEDYTACLKAQNGTCAICMEPPSGSKLAIDHDHVTGEFRGLLCMQCNTALGQFRDNPATMRRAIIYITNGGTIGHTRTNTGSTQNVASFSCSGRHASDKKGSQ